MTALMHLAVGSFYDEDVHTNSIFFNSHHTKKQIKMMKKLKEVGAEIDTQDHEGNTALLLTVIDEPFDVQIPKIHFLLESGANPIIQNEDGNTVLHKAAMVENKKAIKIIIERAPEI